MTPTNLSSTGAFWARFRFSVVGSLLSSPPARNAEDGYPRPCRQNLVASDDRARCPVHGRHHRTLVLHGAAPTRRPCACPAPRRAQGLRQGILDRCRCGATHAPVSRPPALELPTALRQPGRFSEGQSRAGTAPLLFHGQALHADARPGAQTDASAPRASGRSSRGRETPDARGPQLRSRVCRVAVAPRFPPRIEEGAHSERPVAAADRAGHPRRSFAIVLPHPVVSFGDRRGPGAWPLAGDPEAWLATCRS